MLIDRNARTSEAALPELNHRSLGIVVITIGLVGVLAEGMSATPSPSALSVFGSVLAVGIWWLVHLRARSSH